MRRIAGSPARSARPGPTSSTAGSKSSSCSIDAEPAGSREWRRSVWRRSAQRRSRRVDRGPLATAVMSRRAGLEVVGLQ
jgi:hypothetical protein